MPNVLNDVYTRNNQVKTHTGSLTVNLSDLSLTNADISLLDKGLKFIPTYRYLPVNRIYEAQNRLIRSLKLRDYFSDEDTDNDYDYNRKTFTYPSTWTPPDHKIADSTLETIQELITATQSAIKKNGVIRNKLLVVNRNNNNLTAAEITSLKQLRSNSNIVIKPADKGGATVLLNKDAYLREAHRQLGNRQYYTKLREPIYKSNISKINEILESMKSDKFISAKQLQYLQAKDTDRARVFYLLPKIHKPRDKWPQPNMPEGRPIVSDCGSESYRVSQYIDSFIRPISTRHAAYIKDTYDFISKIRGQKIHKNALLVTGDVSSLYTNMHIDRTLQVTKNALARYPDAERPDCHIMRLLDITLRNNDFTFNGEFFLQICGTAMGKSYAPGLADLYLEKFDEKATHGFKIKPQLYFRFLDDIHFVWTGTAEELTEFEIYLNSLIDGIKITLNFSHEKVDFLDTTIYRIADPSAPDTDILQTRVFFKDTDTHQLLHRQSFHPKHTFTGVLKAQLLRFKRISSSHSDYSDACSILFAALQKRSYSKSLLRKMKRDIWNLNDISPKPKDHHQKLLPIVIPYNKIGIELARSWKSIIGQSQLFDDDSRLLTAFCNSQNLYQKLVRSSFSVNGQHSKDNSKVKLRKNNNVKPGSLRCPNVKCKACSYIVETSSFGSSHNNRKFRLHNKFTCASSNIVYLVTCTKCYKQYVGETGRSLRDRITDHVSCIKLKKQTPIGLHFNQAGHSLKHFSVLAIEQFDENSESIRRMKEITWQHLLQTAHPLGINNLKQNHL